VLTISENTGVTDLVLDPKNPDVIYASTFQRRRHVGQAIGGGREAGIHKSTNGGRTWTKLRSGLPKCDLGRIALAIDGRRSPTEVYALVEAQGGQGFYKSTNAGASWVRYAKQAAAAGRGGGGGGGGAGRGGRAGGAADSIATNCAGTSVAIDSTQTWFSNGTGQYYSGAHRAGTRVSRAERSIPCTSITTTSRSIRLIATTSC
jgi:hypothetical protein